MTKTNVTSVVTSVDAVPLHIDADGWCNAALRFPSPNFNARPVDATIDLLVIHNISLPAGEFGQGYIADLFLNRLDCDAHTSFDRLRGLEVSSHFVIARDGTLMQFVSTHDRAWHAGVSHFEGRNGCNDFSIGIELEGTDDAPFEPGQYVTLFALTLSLGQRYAALVIVGHQDIAPGRKTDPGACFDWGAYQDFVARHRSGDSDSNTAHMHLAFVAQPDDVPPVALVAP